jgi:colicin import membrane protein
MEATTTLPRDNLMPREPRGMGPGLLLALLVHGLLVVGLTLSVRWRASEPEGVEAELWASVPQIAAPPAVTPEPQPVAKPEPPPPPRPAPKEEPQPDAQIAIDKAKREEERKKKEEAEKLAEKRKQEEADKRRKQLEEQKLAALREQNLKRMMGQAGAGGDPSSTGQAERTAGPSAGYAGRIKARIKPNIVFTDQPSGNPLAEVELRLAPDGTILSQKLVTSSGLKEWDDAVQRAIDRTQVLPRDVDGTVPSRMVIAFRPRDL